ncbi:MAG: energy transducer TonB [Bacteroidota bacterium]
MTRFMYSFLLLLLGNAIGAQVQIDLANSSWTVVTDSYSGANTSGSELFFQKDGTLLIQNEHGLLQTPYGQTDNKLEFAGQVYTITPGEGDQVTLLRKGDGRSLQVETSQEVAPTIDSPPFILGDFRLDGFYYRYEGVAGSAYTYYRFLPSGGVISFKTIIAPEDVAPYLNRAYASNEDEFRLSYMMAAETTEGQPVDDILTYTLLLSEDGVDTEVVSTFSLQDGKAKFHEEARAAVKGQLYETKHELTFFASSELSTWEGEALNTGNPGRADEILPLPQIVEPEMIFKKVEEPPRFPGCEQITDKAQRHACQQHKLLLFIYGNITYPETAIKNGIEGTVIITFIVEKDGRITEANILREIGGGCGEESLRVVNLMNEQGIRWIPGKVQGRAVRVQFNLPVKFKLEDPDPEEEERKGRRRRKRG